MLRASEAARACQRGVPASVPASISSALVLASAPAALPTSTPKQTCRSFAAASHGELHRFRAVCVSCKRESLSRRSYESQSRQNKWRSAHRTLSMRRTGHTTFELSHTKKMRTEASVHRRNTPSCVAHPCDATVATVIFVWTPEPAHSRFWQVISCGVRIDFDPKRFGPRSRRNPAPAKTPRWPVWTPEPGFQPSPLGGGTSSQARRYN